MRVQLLPGTCRVRPLPFPVPAGDTLSTFTRSGPPGRWRRATGVRMPPETERAGLVIRQAMEAGQEPRIAGRQVGLRGQDISRVNLSGHDLVSILFSNQAVGCQGSDSLASYGVGLDPT